jgi:hypothetical protein
MFPDAARAFSGKPAAGLDSVVTAGFPKENATSMKSSPAS